MPFKKGQSGNSSGRPAGSGVAGKLRKAILDKSPELLQVVIDKALEDGDATAALALLNKVIPNLKSVSEPVKFKVDTSKGLTQVGENIVKAIGQGSLPLDAGTQLITSLSSLAKLQETDDLAKDIEEIKKILATEGIGT